MNRANYINGRRRKRNICDQVMVKRNEQKRADEKLEGRKRKRKRENERELQYYI